MDIRTTETSDRKGSSRTMITSGVEPRALIVAVLAVVWLLLSALALIEIRRMAQDLGSARIQHAVELQRAYTEGEARGRVAALERLLGQLDQRLQVTEVTLGLRSVGGKGTESDAEDGQTTNDGN